jgi:hypothetical protein
VPPPAAPAVSPPGEILRLLAEARRRIGVVARREVKGAPYPVLSSEDVVNAAWPALDALGLVVLPSGITTTSEAAAVHRWDKNLNAYSDHPARLARVDSAYRFLAPDGSYIEAHVSGEACDEGDSSVAQAQTAALKVALLHVLGIRTRTPGRERPRPAPQAAGAPPAGQAAPARTAPPAAAPAGHTPAEARQLLWAHILDLAHGDVEVGSHWLAAVTAWKDRPGVSDAAALTDKAATYLYANRAKAFSPDALAKFEAQRGAM